MYLGSGGGGGGLVGAVGFFFMGVFIVFWSGSFICIFWGFGGFFFFVFCKSYIIFNNNCFKKNVLKYFNYLMCYVFFKDLVGINSG